MTVLGVKRVKSIRAIKINNAYLTIINREVLEKSHEK